ncbi:MAG: oligosaccharide flippase family protein [Candidatus Acidiferrales bacterium]
MGFRERASRLLSGDGLKAKAFRGGAWLGSGSFAEQASRFGRNMLLTRLLAPEAFGTMAVVMSATSVLASIMDVGAREGLIQNPRGHEKGYVGATWWLAFGRSFAIYILLFLAAPFVARFYGNAELTALLRVAGAGLIFEGVMSARAYVAIKEMKFRKWAAINHGGGITGVLVTVVLAFFIRDVWALVIGSVAENAARCLYSYVICPFLPPLRWDRAAMRELFGFSKGVFGLAILNLIFIRADIFVLAKLYSAAELGLYAMAIYMVQTPTGFLMNLLGQTLLPAFSQVQHDAERTRRIFTRVTSALLLAGLPAVVFICFCGHSLLTLIYGWRYAAAAGALIVASCVALLNVINGQITMIFYARGKPQLHRTCVLIMALTMIVLIYPFAKRFGLVGGQLACLIAMVFGLLFQALRIRRLVDLEFAKYGKVLAVAAAMAAGVALVCFGGRHFEALTSPVPNILFGAAGCAAAYALSLGFVLRGNLKELA